VNGPGSDVWWQFHGLALREPLALSLVISAVLVIVAWSLARRLARPGSAVPGWAEAAFAALENAVADVVPAADVPRVLPFVGTLWLFVLIANLVGLVPGLASPTRDLSVTSALAAIVFFAVHVYGVRAAGWAAYLRHYLSPSPILLPFHLVSEITRTLALAIRLFGNMMSLEMAALLVLLVAGLLVPVPLLLLHVVEALVQAYIFGMLALIYIGSALEVHHRRQEAAADVPTPLSQEQR
jgi:F-type H+-transporting ATPase subunit a